MWWCSNCVHSRFVLWRNMWFALLYICFAGYSLCYILLVTTSHLWISLICEYKHSISRFSYCKVIRRYQRFVQVDSPFLIRCSTRWHCKQTYIWGLMLLYKLIDWAFHYFSYSQNICQIHNISVDIDECVDNLCENAATCEDGVNGYTCVCVDGYTGVYCSIGKCKSLDILAYTVM